MCCIKVQRTEHEDQNVIKVLLAAPKTAITRKWCKEDPSTLRHMKRLTHIQRIQQSVFQENGKSGLPIKPITKSLRKPLYKE